MTDNGNGINDFDKKRAKEVATINNHPLVHTNDFLDRYMNHDDGNDDGDFDNKMAGDNATMDNDSLLCTNDFPKKYENHCQ